MHNKKKKKITGMIAPIKYNMNPGDINMLQLLPVD